jgi:ABC-2 type transport system permease protein
VNPVSSLVGAVRGPVDGEVAGSDVVLVLVRAAALVALLGPLTMRRHRTRN